MPEREPDRAEFVREFDLDRTTAFSDGVFAIAITLLILNVEVPDLPDDKHGELGHQLQEILPHILVYFLSFAVVSRYWVLHHRFFGSLERVNGRLIMLNLVYLAFVAFMPFPTDVLGEYGDQALAVTLYAATVAVVAGLGVVMRLAAVKDWLVKSDVDDPHLVDPHSIRFHFLLPAIFLLSIPVAWLISPEAGELVWLLLFLQGWLFTRLGRRAE